MPVAVSNFFTAIFHLAYNASLYVWRSAYNIFLKHVHFLRFYYGRIWDSFDKIRPVRLVLKYYIQMQDMGIKDPEIVALVNQIEELERKLHAHPLHKVYPIVLNNSHILLFHRSFEGSMLLTFFFAIRSLLNHFTVQMQSQDVHQMKCFQRKAVVNHEIQQLKSKMRDSQVLPFLDAPFLTRFHSWLKHIGWVINLYMDESQPHLVNYFATLVGIATYIYQPRIPFGFPHLSPWKHPTRFNCYYKHIKNSLWLGTVWLWISFLIFFYFIFLIM